MPRIWCNVVSTGECESWSSSCCTATFNLSMSVHVLLTNQFTFTKPSKLSKFPLLQLSPYWTFLSQLSTRFTHPHRLLTRHAHTPVTLSSSVRNPDCLATVLFIHISSSTEGAISIQTHVISWQMLAFCVNIPCTGTG